jgi:outer membrane protein TolC
LIAASEYNSSLLESRAHFDETAATVTTARAHPNPTISLGGEYDLKQSGEPAWLYSVGTSFLLETPRTRKLRLDIAQSNLKGARLDYEETLWSVRRDLRAALLTLSIEERRAAILTADVELNERLVRMMEARVREGEAAGSDRLQTELEWARARTALADANQKANAARAKLASSIGMPIDALSRARLVLPRIDSPEPLDEAHIDELRARAALARTDLERAIADYDARELELHEQIRAQYPQLSLGPGYSWDHGIPKATFGISFTAPVLNLNRGPIAEAAARRAKAAQHVMTVQQQALNEIDAARFDYRVQVRSLALARERQRAAIAAADQLDRAVAEGAEDRPTSVAARIAADAEALAELDALERAQTALGQLEDALRTPFDAQELHIQSPLSSGTP